MKPTLSAPIHSLPVNTATWLLNHMVPASLTGDLLEEFNEGRSVLWFCRQAAIAIAASSSSKSRPYTLPVLFSAIWSMFYPAWLGLEKAFLIEPLLRRWESLNWPFSSSCEAACGYLGAISFVWLGFFLFLALRPNVSAPVSIVRILLSLSISFNIFFLASIAIVTQLAINAPDVNGLIHQDLQSNLRSLATTIPPALSLFSAILFASFRRTQFKNPASA